MATILGIETSCDETAAAVVINGVIKSNVVASQIKIHAKTGGVVPEVAARMHVEKIIPVIEKALKSAKLKIENCDALAVTIGPGLLGSLLVGTETAKALAYVFKKPIIGTNHLEGHIVSAIAEQFPIFSSQFSKILPALALIVSGGHTELVLIKKLFDYEVIGQTQDDAAGEAFDKIAKLLSLPYPGGPHLAKLAEKGNSKMFNFPRGMINENNFDFSFSGLKTAVLYFLKKHPKANRADVSASVQEAIVEVLVQKTLSAARHHSVKIIFMGGGVSANKYLRAQIAQSLRSHKSPKLMIAPQGLTTDNAAMIALSGYLRFMAGKTDNWYNIKANPSLGL